MKNFLDIDIVISPPPGGVYAVRAASDQSGPCNSTVKLPFTLADLAVFGVAETARDIGSIAPKATGSGAAGATGHKSAEDYGVELFEALFQGDIRDLLTSAENTAQHSVNTGVRIRLSMDLQAPGMAEVVSLPWEWMCRR